MSRAIDKNSWLNSITMLQKDICMTLIINNSANCLQHRLLQSVLCISFYIGILVNGNRDTCRVPYDKQLATCFLNYNFHGGLAEIYRASNYAIYRDVIMSAMASQITSLTIFTQSFIQAQIKENIKVLRHWSLWGEFTSERWIPHTTGW